MQLSLMKYLSGCTMSLLALFAPIKPLIICVVVFVAVDFLTGIAADRKRKRRGGEDWHFESRKAWNTITKLTFVMAGVVLAWMIDSMILNFITLNLANLFTGFVCGVEFWSYLENAAFISDHPVFRRLRRYMEQQLNRSLQEAASVATPKSDEQGIAQL